MWRINMISNKKLIECGIIIDDNGGHVIKKYYYNEIEIDPFLIFEDGFDDIEYTMNDLLELIFQAGKREKSNEIKECLGLK